MAIPPLVLRIVADSSGVKAGTTKAAAQVNGLRGQVQQNASLIKGALVGAVVAFGVSSVKAFAQAEQVFAQTEAVIRSTGGAAGVTAEEMRDLASSFQDTTTFADEAVLGAENLLLTFTKIGGETLPAATQAVLDMSTALGQDLKSSAIQLGKALNNPEVGLTALRRVGVNFSEAQVEVIKQLDATGRSAEAQALIIKELNTEFGGSASAAADTFAGRLEHLKNTVNDLQEDIGGALVQDLEGFVTLFEDLAGAAEFVGDKIAAIDFGALQGEAEGATGPVQGFLDTFNPLKLGTTYERTKDGLNEIGQSIGIVSRETMTGTSANQAWGDSVTDVAGAFPDLANALGIATDAQEANNEATRLSISIRREAAGGLLGLIEASRTYAEAQALVNRLERQGKEGTAEYRAAVGDLLGQRLELSGALDELQTQWKEQGVSLRQAKDALEEVGRSAGLQGAALRRFIRRGLAPVNEELDQLKAGSPYTFEVRAIANFSQLRSKLAGLEARYDLGIGKAAGGPVSMGHPYVVGERGPELFVPSVAGTIVPNGAGGGRTKREAAYLDRARFERDHAYSREYEGWR